MAEVRCPDCGEADILEVHIEEYSATLAVDDSGAYVEPEEDDLERDDAYLKGFSCWKCSSLWETFDDLKRTINGTETEESRAKRLAAKGEAEAYLSWASAEIARVKDPELRRIMDEHVSRMCAD